MLESPRQCKDRSICHAPGIRCMIFTKRGTYHFLTEVELTPLFMFYCATERERERAQRLRYVGVSTIELTQWRAPIITSMYEYLFVFDLDSIANDIYCISPIRC